MLKTPVNIKRVKIILGFICVVGVLLILRIAQIQTFAASFYVKKADIQQKEKKDYTGIRGCILDRRYRILAQSSMAVDIAVDPDEIRRWVFQYSEIKSTSVAYDELQKNPHIQEIARVISETLNLNYDDMLERLTRPKKDKKNQIIDPRLLSRNVVIAKAVDSNRAELLKQVQISTNRIKNDRFYRKKYSETDEIPGLIFNTRERREYLTQTIASHVIGARNQNGNAEAGIELSQSSVMEPQKVSVKGAFDLHGRQIIRGAIGALPDPAPGRSVVLTIDLGLQQVVERVLDECQNERSPQGVNAIVMSARNGEILAMACRPTYNPNERSQSAPDKAGNRPVLPSGSLPINTRMINRCVENAIEPGSSFKILTVAAALENGLITENTVMHCAGREKVGGIPLKCLGKYEHIGHGSLTPTGILSMSCNILAAKLALRLGKDRFYEFLHNCNLGKPTGCGLPAEAAGLMNDIKDTDPAAKRSLANIGFGQNILVSDLQLAAAVSAIVNGGIYYRPHVVAGFLNPIAENENWRNPPVVIKRVCSENTSRIMRKMLREVVEKGTGRTARIKGYAIGGKTATAQIYDTKLKQYLKGPTDNIFGFVLAAPMDRPADFVVVVNVQQPKIGLHGSDVAAPVARRIAEYLLAQPNLFPKIQKPVNTPAGNESVGTGAPA